MGDKSGIEWTDATWNPLAGCSIVSAGCKNCYAMKQAHRLEHNFGQAKYAGTTKKVNGKAVWTGKINLDGKSLLQPSKWSTPRRIFVNSMSDLFHESVPTEWIDKVFDAMAAAPWHTYQILTKRPDRMREWAATAIVDHHLCEGSGCNYCGDGAGRVPWKTHPFPNVWLGVSVEDQTSADQRIPHLVKTPAAVRFLSMEPLLDTVDLLKAGAITDKTPGMEPVGKVDWVILGGESGPGARWLNMNDARRIIRDCKAAGVAVFVKQLGPRPVEFERNDETNRFEFPWPPFTLKHRKGGDINEWPEDLRVREFPVPAASSPAGPGATTNRGA